MLKKQTLKYCKFRKHKDADCGRAFYSGDGVTTDFCVIHFHTVCVTCGQKAIKNCDIFSCSRKKKPAPLCEKDFCKTEHSINSHTGLGRM